MSQTRHPLENRRICIALVLLFGLASACRSDDGASVAGAPSPRASRSPLQSREPDQGRDVIFPGPGQSEMEGSLFGRSRAGVVLSPQLSQTREAWFPLARVLEKRGFTALSIDSLEEDLDGEVIAGARFLRRKGATRVFAVGASKGATAVLGAAVRSDMLAGVIAVSPVLSFGDVTLRRSGISTLTEPALIIVDENDSSIFAVEDIESWNSEIGVERINDVGAHGTDYLHSERKRDAFIKAVLRFLQR